MSAPFGLWLGAVVLAGAAAVAILPAPRRIRAAAFLAVLILAPVLVAADNWSTERFVELRDQPVLVAVGALMGAGVLAVLARWLGARPAAFALLIIAALPFRLPVDLGESANLLIPLYLAIAAPAGLAALRALRAPDASASARPVGPWIPRTDESVVGSLKGPARLIPPALAASVVLFAVQSAYSEDFSAALNELAFFFAPFALAFALLLEARWSPSVLRAALTILVAEGLLFVGVATGQYVAGEVFWNEKVIEGNDAHTWFRVNSLFFDPNIFGRYLGVTMVIGAAIVAFAVDRREVAVAAGLYAVALVGMGMSFSQSSLVALMAGLVVIAMVRWRPRWALLAGGLAAAGVVAGLLFGGSSEELSVGQSLDSQSSGRGGLVTGGAELFGNRPLAGYGSGAFETEFREEFGGGRGVAVTSHTEPITVAAEQGAVGLAVYGTLLAVSLLALLEGMRTLTRSRQRAEAPLARGEESRFRQTKIARVGIFAAYTAMIVHSFVYAAFLTDPITWALLAIGLALTPSAASD